jgi:GDPmannose 4,6-dehydratase
MSNALILGINGQDGIFLTRLLENQGKKVTGISKSPIPSKYLPKSIDYIEGDLRNTERIVQLVLERDIVEIYNFAALSSVAQSYSQPMLTKEVNYLAVRSLLDMVYSEPSLRECKFFQASSSEMFGNVNYHPQDENTPFDPQSPYGLAKLDAHLYCKRKREQGFFVCCGILYNHESSYRPSTFLSKKVTSTVARISLGSKEYLYVGNLDAERDWGAAEEYVEAIWRIISHGDPMDFIVATGKSHTVRDLIHYALQSVSLESKFEELIKVDSELLRPIDLIKTVGDPSLILKTLGWQCRQNLEQIVSQMVYAELTNQAK